MRASPHGGPCVGVPIGTTGGFPYPPATENIIKGVWKGGSAPFLEKLFIPALDIRAQGKVFSVKKTFPEKPKRKCREWKEK